MGSSEGSLQTTVEERLRYGVSRLCDLNLHSSNLRHPLCPSGPSAVDQGEPLLKRRSTTTTLQAYLRHKENQNSAKGSSMSAECLQQDSTNHSGEVVSVKKGSRGFCQPLNSEHLSEMLNSLSLMSLFIPCSLAPTLIRKSNSTGSLVQSNPLSQSCHFYTTDTCDFLSNPWTKGKARGTEEDSNVTAYDEESRIHPADLCSKKKR